MATFLFDEIIFGPVTSRRLGRSLGINLLPTNSKVCNFNCIYCECGLTDSIEGELPTRKQVASKLESTLKDFKTRSSEIDTITFAGNGEPTLHPEFDKIIDDTYSLRNKYFPGAKIALLTNSTTLINIKILDTLKKIDQPILKIDSVHHKTIELLNCPIGEFDIKEIINIIKKMSDPIIQTMFVKGTYNDIPIDNTTDYEINPWLKTIIEINPKLVMIYTIERDTPFDTLKKIPMKKLNDIAKMVEENNISVQISA